jgi:hypothetical protein
MTTSPLTVTHFDAESLYRWALKCATEAENLGADDASRVRFMKMREALLVLAENDKWLQDIVNPKASTFATSHPIGHRRKISEIRVGGQSTLA